MAKLGAAWANAAAWASIRKPTVHNLGCKAPPPRWRADRSNRAPKQSRAACLFELLMSQQLLSQETPTERTDQAASRAAASMLAPKVVLTGVTGLRNRGVEALVVTTIAGLRAQWPAAQITVLSRSPEYDSFRLIGCTDVKVIANTLHDLQPWREQMTRTLRSLLRHGQLPCDAAQRAIREASLLIALGGDVFSSDYASARPIYIHCSLHCAITCRWRCWATPSARSKPPPKVRNGWMSLAAVR